MKHIKRRIAALAMSCALVLTLSPAAFAANFADMPEEGNWATEALQAAVDNSLLTGDGNGLLNPNGNLTRAEMATIIVRAFGTTQTKDVSGFVDVDTSAWYVTGGFLPSAYFMQIMQGDGDRMTPNDAITREQAFAILARALKLEDGSADTLAQFDDGSKVASYFVGSVAAMVEAGYVKGSSNSINPQNNITRAEFAQLMHNIFGAYIAAEGDYTELADGSIMISKPGVTIHDTTVKGDVIIGEGVGEGDVFFQNVTIEGRVVVRGGGVNSIHFINSETLKVVVSKILGLVRVVADSASTVPEVSVVAGSDTVTVEGTVAAVTVDSATPVEVKDATVETITVNADDAAVTIGGESSVATVTVAGAADVAITGESSVTTVTVSAAAAVEITGSSTVAAVEAAAGTVTASGNATVETITTTGADVTVAETATVATVEVPETAENVTVTVADTATVDTVKAETDITLDGADNVGAVEAPEDVTVGDSEGNQVDTTEPTTPPTEDVPVIIPPSTGDNENNGDDDNNGDDGDDVTPEVPEEHEHTFTWTYNSTQHWKVCSVCGETDTETEKANHDTEGTDGACSVCGYKVTIEEGEGALTHEHKWVEDTANSQAATCTEAGYTAYKCSGEEGETCTATKQEPIAALGHNWDEGTETKAPTCINVGIKTFTCQRAGCDETYTEEIAPVSTAHNVTGVAFTVSKTDSTKHAQICTLCHQEVNAAAHDFGNDNSEEECTVCGAANPNHVDSDDTIEVTCSADGCSCKVTLPSTATDAEKSAAKCDCCKNGTCDGSCDACNGG